MEHKSAYSRDVFFLILIYTASHFLLCVISGQWWDDWMYWTYNSDRLIETYTKTGYPLQAYNIMSVMWIPNWGYRIVVFFLFLFAGLTFYAIMRNISFLSDNAFWIAAVAINVPVNDVRVVLNCFGYSLELPLFMLGFYLALKMNSMAGKKKYIVRILSIVVLIYSYTMESLLVFTGLIWLYFMSIIWTHNTDANIFEKVSLFVKSYWDYLVLPFCYFILRRVFFKTSGRYAGHNDVSLSLLLNGIARSPYSSFVTLNRIRQSYTSQLSLISITVIIIIAILFTLFNHNKDYENADDARISRKNILTVILGIIVYYAGIFPYIVILEGIPLRSTSVESRHTMLAGFGVSIIIIGVSRLIPVKKYLQNLIPIAVITLGIFHFNSWYLRYQADWYYQLGFKNLIEENQGFNDDNTILCNFRISSPIEGTRSYSLNGMSYIVTGHKDKFYFPGIEFLDEGLPTKDGTSKIEEIKADGNNCDDYDASDTSIDGILFIDNTPISSSKAIALRIHEISGNPTFNDEIVHISPGQYVKISSEVSDSIYELYRDGELTTDYIEELRKD